MKRRFWMAVVLAAAAVLAAPAWAGMNAGVTANMYWQEGTSQGLASRHSFSPTPQLIVTIKGLSNFRGADVQLGINLLNGGVLPGAWMGTGTGGCNEGNFEYFVGGRGGAYPNVFTTAPALPGLVWSQNREISENQPNDCLASPYTALLWLCAAGAAGVARDPAAEYGVWAVHFDLTADCPGGYNDPQGASSVCISPDKRSPCLFPVHGPVITVVDANTIKDYATFPGDSPCLSWGPVSGGGCTVLTVTPAPPATWGQLKKLYR